MVQTLTCYTSSLTGQSYDNEQEAIGAETKFIIDKMVNFNSTNDGFWFMPINRQSMNCIEADGHSPDEKSMDSYYNIASHGTALFNTGLYNMMMFHNCPRDSFLKYPFTLEEYVRSRDSYKIDQHEFLKKLENVKLMRNMQLIHIWKVHNDFRGAELKKLIQLLTPDFIEQIPESAFTSESGLTMIIRWNDNPIDWIMVHNIEKLMEMSVVGMTNAVRYANTFR